MEDVIRDTNEEQCGRMGGSRDVRMGQLPWPPQHMTLWVVLWFSNLGTLTLFVSMLLEATMTN